MTSRARWGALAVVSLATLMAYLDNNVINVAIPTIQRSLHLSVSGLEWIVSSYLLTLAGLMLVGGRLGDVYGRRRVFLIGLAVFTLSSLVSGLAGSGGVLIGAGTVQGVIALESAVLGAAPVEGVVLRYGWFYGPGASAKAGGTPALHVDAAAQAAVLAVERGAPGVYNVAEPQGAVSIEKARRELGWDPTFRAP